MRGEMLRFRPKARALGLGMVPGGPNSSEGSLSELFGVRLMIGLAFAPIDPAPETSADIT